MTRNTVQRSKSCNAMSFSTMPAAGQKVNMAVTQSEEKKKVTKKRIDGSSGELYKSQFHLRFNSISEPVNPSALQQTITTEFGRDKSGKRVRSPWIKDPFKSQIVIA